MTPLHAEFVIAIWLLHGGSWKWTKGLFNMTTPQVKALGTMGWDIGDDMCRVPIEYMNAALTAYDESKGKKGWHVEKHRRR